MNCNCRDCREDRAERQGEYLQELASRLSEWEIVDVSDVIDAYDEEVVVEYKMGDVTLVGSGMSSCGDLVEVYAESIEIKD